MLWMIKDRLRGGLCSVMLGIGVCCRCMSLMNLLLLCVVYRWGGFGSGDCFGDLVVGGLDY